MKPRTMDDFQGESRASGNQVNYKHCPVCGSDGWKLYVNPETGMWFCHAGQHGAGGQVEVGRQLHLQEEGAAILRILDGAQNPAPTSEVELPPFGELSRAARRYLHRRGFTDEDIRCFGLVEWEDEYRILIPYFDDRGQLVYWNSRLYSDNLGDGPKYKAAPGKHPLYVPERRVSDSVVVVEGAFDALAVVKHTPDTAIALGGKYLPRYLRKPLRQEISRAILYSVGEVVVALDGDAMAQSLTLAKTMPVPPRMPVRLAHFEYGEDPGNVSPERLREVLSGRQELRTED